MEASAWSGPASQPASRVCAGVDDDDHACGPQDEDASRRSLSVPPSDPSVALRRLAWPKTLRSESLGRRAPARRQQRPHSQAAQSRPPKPPNYAPRF